jgi:TorA maturation chaperone TorD
MSVNRPLQEIIDLVQDRAVTYTFLSRLLRQEMSQAALGHLLAELSGGQAAEEVTSEGYTLLRQFARSVQPLDLAEVETELAAEYAGVILAGETEGVSPYESVYTSPDRMLMQQGRDQVLAAYRSQGLDKVREFKEPEDHIAIELEFMAYLCQQTAEKLQQGDLSAAQTALLRQQAFLDDHLMVWAPEFCRDLVRRSRSDFYRGVAMLTAEHLDQEQATVAEILAALAAGAEGK